MFHFTTRTEKSMLQQQGQRVIEVSSRAPLPFRYLSPFYPHGHVPVLGMSGTTADSVEGVWQGLKLLQGTIDPTYFHGRGKKRRGKPTGHLYGTEILDYREARDVIYVTLYRWMIYEAPHARDTALQLLREGRHQDIFVHDVETNGNIDDLTRPLAHAAVLVDILNDNLAALERYEMDPAFKQHYDADTDSFGVLSYELYPLADFLIQEGRGASPPSWRRVGLSDVGVW